MTDTLRSIIEKMEHSDAIRQIQGVNLKCAPSSLPATFRVGRHSILGEGLQGSILRSTALEAQAKEKI